MIGIMRGTTRMREAVQGLPAPIASFTPKSSKCLELNVAVTATQSGSGDPSPNNVRPIIGWDKVSVVRCGKNICPSTNDNLLDYAPFDHFTFENGTITTSGNTLCGFVYPVKPNSTITVSIKSNDSQEVTFRIREYYGKPDSWADKYNNRQVNVNAQLNNNRYTLTVAENTTYVVLGFYITTPNITVYDCQCEYGNTATAYEPYNGNTYIINLGNTYYGGVLDVTSGVLSVTHELIILNGSEMWSNDGARGSVMGFNNNPQFTHSYIGYLMCNEFKVIPTSTTIGDYQTKLSVLAVGNGISVKNPDALAPTALKAYLSSNPMYCLMELATPFTIQLTPTEVELLANQVNTIFADSGDINSLVFGGLVNTVLVGRG